MTARLTSALHFFALLSHFFLLINYNYGQGIGKTLYIYKDPDNSKEEKYFLIDKNDFNIGDGITLGRSRRETSGDKNSSEAQPTITTKVNFLNDTHDQLIVHWANEQSNIVICLTKDSNRVNSSTPTRPSSVYISYDNGASFENKTEAFKYKNHTHTQYATLDKFYYHPKFNNHVVFVDNHAIRTNSMIFITKNNGETIERVECPFTLSEISFDEDHPDTFVVLDKIDPFRQLWMTRNSGKNWLVIHEKVKAFFWSNSQPRKLLIQRAEPLGWSTVVEMDPILGMKEQRKMKILIENVIDFQVRGDYKFATTKEGKHRTTESDDLSLWVSFKDQKFIMAKFSTDLDLKNYYIADISNGRIFVAIAHNQNKANLYVSEVIDKQTIKFELSLKDIFGYFPNPTWEDSWLEDIESEAFTDLYKVEGLRGIYIASQVNQLSEGDFIGPENLISVITHDHGVTWNRLKSPEKNHKGLSIHCGNNCSLHLHEKLSQVDPGTRSVSIISSKSAPGVIMATGVLGSNLKGHPALYVSRDAGLNWKQVLNDDYLFNIGDHGGVLVVVKSSKSHGETRDISYSIDEGQTWNTYKFNDDNLKVHGLTTKTGGKTTSFIMFVSELGLHKWQMIKVDFRDVFKRDCKEDDYEFWSPSSTDQSVIPCVLGRREIYQRKVPTANCYTGTDYDRSVKFETCLCDFNDYECDFGFVKDGLPFRCIRDTAHENYDPYEIPATCRPGKFYNRTKGYKKIPDDDCVGGISRRFEPDEIPCPIGKPSEFLLVAQENQFFRIDLITHNLEVLPVHNSGNVVAIEYDLKNNCLYRADFDIGKISRQCFENGKSYSEILVETDLNYIKGMALDWVSNVLYFIDGGENRIEIIRTDISSHGKMRRTILGRDNLKSIAVHPMMGYIFCTDWAFQNASISRANLDGTNIKRLFTEGTVEYPNGITIDYISERIYWVDKDYIGSSDFDGRRFKKVLHDSNEVSDPIAIGVFKDKMYWINWMESMIFVADKEYGSRITTIPKDISVQVLKIVADSIQSGTNKCENNTVCSHICLGTPNNSFVCLCPDGMEMISGKCLCPGGILPHTNSTCPQVTTTCAPTEFSCNNEMCIPESWRCDGENDCGDNFDELSCERKTCSLDEFQCDIIKCIPKLSICDFHRDCRDGSDEKNCSKVVQQLTCELNKISCDNACLPKEWQCDGIFDCKDGSDEEGCEIDKCKDRPFLCDFNQNSSKCIYQSYVCDGYYDCLDGSDEANCSNKTSSPPLSTNSCTEGMFLCNNLKCIQQSLECNDVDDCGDNSDELSCEQKTCSSDEFQCDFDLCISRLSICDSNRDCRDGSDEKYCSKNVL